MASPERDARLMDKAVVEGWRGRPSPNPHVGAVIAKDEDIIAVGHHERAGEAHAEQVALAAAGEAAKGATLYVTLSPCNHVGKTPKCTDAILAAGITRVVVGVLDPNPHVPGGGLERLRANGVETIVLDHRGAKELVGRWEKFITSGLPHVAVKLGLSLDGRIATRTGASKWVTGEEARAKVHELRAQCDAVAVGIGTVLADDPRLTVRHVPGVHPTRVVFDTHLRIPLGSKLVTSAREVPTWVLTGEDAPADVEESLLGAGVRVIRVPTSPEGRVDVQAALEALGALNVVSLLAEGGAELVGSLLAREVADELHAFVAPILLGPRGRPGAADWAGPDVPANAPRIRLPRWELCGGDAYVHGPIEYPSSRLGEHPPFRRGDHPYARAVQRRTAPPYRAAASTKFRALAPIVNRVDDVTRARGSPRRCSAAPSTTRSGGCRSLQKRRTRSFSASATNQRSGAADEWRKGPDPPGPLLDLQLGVQGAAPARPCRMNADRRRHPGERSPPHRER